jgi:hypothetical protein
VIAIRDDGGMLDLAVPRDLLAVARGLQRGGLLRPPALQRDQALHAHGERRLRIGRPA